MHVYLFLKVEKARADRPGALLRECTNERSHQRDTTTTTDNPHRFRNIAYRARYTRLAETPHRTRNGRTRIMQRSLLKGAIYIAIYHRGLWYAALSIAVFVRHRQMARLSDFSKVFPKRIILLGIFLWRLCDNLENLLI